MLAEPSAHKQSRLPRALSIFHSPLVEVVWKCTEVDLSRTTTKWAPGATMGVFNEPQRTWRLFFATKKSIFFVKFVLFMS